MKERRFQEIIERHTNLPYKNQFIFNLRILRIMFPRLFRFFILQAQHKLHLEIRKGDPNTWNSPKLNDLIVIVDKSILDLPNGFTFSDVYIYDLFKNSVHIGSAFYINKKSHWYLENVYVIQEEEGKGYGSFLLDKSCDLVLKVQKLDMKLLCSSKDQPDVRGFNRYQWYLRHGFKGNPQSWLTRSLK